MSDPAVTIRHMNAAKPGKLTREQMQAALEKARREHLERKARGKHDPLDDWPDGPPLGDEEAMSRWDAAFREWQQKHEGLL